jgi:hypothetical protein
MNTDSINRNPGGLFWLRGPLNWYSGSVTPQRGGRTTRRWEGKDTVKVRPIVILRATRDFYDPEFDASSALDPNGSLPMTPAVDIVALVPGKGICLIRTNDEFIEDSHPGIDNV